MNEEKTATGGCQVDTMVRQNALIMASCLVLPSGETLWVQTDTGRDYLMKIIEAWKEQHPEYNDTKCTMGCVEIMMPLEKYNAIMATNEFSWPKE